MCTRTHFEKEAEIIRKWAIKLQQTNIYAWNWTPYPPLLDSASSYTCPYPPHEARWTELKPQEWVHRSPYFSEPPWYETANSIFTPINFLCIKRGSLRKYIARNKKSMRNSTRWKRSFMLWAYGKNTKQEAGQFHIFGIILWSSSAEDLIDLVNLAAEIH